MTVKNHLTLAVLCVLSACAQAQAGDSLLERCFERKATASEKARCKKDLVGKSHEFSGTVLDQIGESELKIDHAYGFFSHIYITAALGKKTAGKVRKGDRTVISGTVESIFDDALNPMVHLVNARIR